MSFKISVIVPCFNESAVLPLLYERLKKLPPIENVDLDFVLVDDGSDDNTWEQIRSFAEMHENWSAVKLSRNFGHQRALWAGLQEASGDAVFVIDADLQDPPELLEEFVHEWRKGFHVVYGVRQKRKESWFKRMAYASFYRLMKRLADIEIPLDSGDFCLMDRQVVDRMLQFNEPSPFIRGARAWIGFEQKPLIYERDARAAGKEKYGYRQLIELAVNGLFSYSRKPIRFLMILGAAVMALSFLGMLFCLGSLVVSGSAFGMQFPMMFLTLLVVVMGGTNLLAIGIVGEYVFKLFEATKSRPTAIVQQRIAVGNANLGHTVQVQSAEDLEKANSANPDQLQNNNSVFSRKAA